jgi:hypothetical protein
MDITILILILILLYLLYVLKYKIQEKFTDNKKFILNNKNHIDNNKNHIVNDENYTAIIVEPRKHKSLKLVLTNFMKNLDERWNFIIFHGLDNKEYIENIINTNNLEKNRITMVNLNVHNLTISDYNKLFYTPVFYDHIPTEMFLVFQTDTMICKKYKDLIYKFMKYDYVGAPWITTSFNKNTCTNKVGNGGLSLRRKSKMLELLNNCKHNNINEDLFFSKVVCNCDNDIYLHKPTDDEAKEFAIEHIYNNKAFGIHKSWLYNNKKISFCEDLDELIDLNTNSYSKIFNYFYSIIFYFFNYFLFF